MRTILEMITVILLIAVTVIAAIGVTGGFEPEAAPTPPSTSGSLVWYTGTSP